MAKKFGKFLLFAASVSAVAAGTYYFLQNKKELLNTASSDEDEDFDDFSEDDLDAEASERTYVSLDSIVSESTTEEFFDDDEAETCTEECVCEEAPAPEAEADTKEDAASDSAAE